MAIYEDLTGKTFGRWTVVCLGNRTKKGRITWKCRCDCGTERELLTSSLKSGHSKSCGCLQKTEESPRIKNICGLRFGRLTVLYRAGRSIRKSIKWHCRCDCGNEIDVDGSSLRSGNTRSCGCLHTEQLNRIDRSAISHIVHGGCRRVNDYERLYVVWKGMKQRCQSKNHTAYKYYGGRGIKICDEWKDYAVFRKWALNNGYDEKAKHGECTLDRIDVDGNYEPGNCRFVDMHIQMLNTRKQKANVQCGKAAKK